MEKGTSQGTTNNEPSAWEELGFPPAQVPPELAPPADREMLLGFWEERLSASDGDSVLKNLRFFETWRSAFRDICKHELAKQKSIISEQHP